jgi:hypothetical protein
MGVADSGGQFVALAARRRQSNATRAHTKAGRPGPDSLPVGVLLAALGRASTAGARAELGATGPHSQQVRGQATQISGRPNDCAPHNAHEQARQPRPVRFGAGPLEWPADRTSERTFTAHYLPAAAGRSRPVRAPIATGARY